MASKKLKEFKKKIVGQFVIDKKLSLKCIVAVNRQKNSGPSTSAVAVQERKKKLEHDFDWVKRGTQFAGSVLGFTVFVTRTAEVLRQQLAIGSVAQFGAGNRFQKNSEKQDARWIGYVRCKHGVNVTVWCMASEFRRNNKIVFNVGEFTCAACLVHSGEQPTGTPAAASSEANAGKAVHMEKIKLEDTNNEERCKNLTDKNMLKRKSMLKELEMIFNNHLATLNKNLDAPDFEFNLISSTLLINVVALNQKYDIQRFHNAHSCSQPKQ